MDNIIILYFIKASISLALFYGLYMFLLKKDTFFKLRRGYFLITMIFSLSFPFLSIEIPIASDEESQLPTYWLSQIEIEDVVVVPEVQETSVSFWSVLLIAIAIVSVLLIVKFLLQLSSIVKLRIDNNSEKISSIRIIKLADEKISPFSFFNWIFVNSGIHNLEKLEEIIAHERIHVKQFHSIDVVLAEMMCICFWWNPFVWLLKNEMKINLEYLADQGVLNAGFNTKEYQYILLQVVNKNTGIPIINNFNVSQLKKRITMMNKKKTSIGKAAKYLLAIPLGFTLLLGNAVQASPDLMSLVTDEFRITEMMSGEQPPYSSSETLANSTSTERSKLSGTVQDDKQPEYPGGESAMHRFLAGNLKYPVAAQEKEINGRVIAKITIKNTGEIGNVDITNNADGLLKEEVIRVISLMPKWTPAQKNGKNIDADFTIPFYFIIKGIEMSAEDKEQNVVDDKHAINIVAYGRAKKDTNGHLSKTSDDDKPFYTVEQMPSYPGGESEMNKYISENLKYPAEAQAKGIQGRVTIRFIIGKTGEISDVTVVRELDPDCDAEAVRVISAMPKWIPGKQNGLNVPVYFTLPIVFKLTDDRSTVLILDGKEINEADLKNEKIKREIEDPTRVANEMKILSDEEAKSKYGDKYKGKTVIEISFSKGNQKETVLNISKVARANKNGQDVLLSVEHMPSYPGGESEMNKYISENLKYPVEAQAKGTQGRVAIRFIVGKTGEIRNVTVVRGIDSECDAEAVRVIKAMPKWIPGREKGENVDVYFTIPITFKLNKVEKNQNTETK